MFYEPITIISAELSALDFYANTNRTNELRLALLNDGYSIVGITLNKDGAKTQAFMVVNPDSKALLPLAKKFGQSSILFSDVSRNTSEVKVATGEISTLGKLCSASKDSIIAPQLYLSFIEDGKEHFFVIDNKGEKNDEFRHEKPNREASERSLEAPRQGKNRRGKRKV